MGETRRFTRPASPTPSDVTLCTRGSLAGDLHAAHSDLPRVGEVGLKSTLRNYETDFLIFVADQLLKIRRVFLFWFCVLYL